MSRRPGRNVNRRHVDMDLRPLQRQRRALNRTGLVIAGLLAILLVASLVAHELTSGETGPEEEGGISQPVEGAVPVFVQRIIDGDTLEVRAAGTDITVRLYGVDTPERDEACYQEATDRLEALAGSRVQLLPDARLTDRFGRELRYVYASDGTLIDEALVAEGYGYAWTDDGSMREQIMAAEAEARAAGRGCLWRG
ncbi:MAG: thermonuclease family protein [Dehalococcoidia bacterium]|nr:thermonuclease family protein [Dehalococcoidia bacterium]